MEEETFPGTEVSQEDLDANRFTIIPYHAGFRYRWDTGVAIGRFLAELKKGRILASRCGKCRRVLVPPRIFCERDFVPIGDWVYVKDTGTVNTYSIAYIAADASRLKKPLVIGVIELDGASRGVGILHRINAKAHDVCIGMKVRAVWRARSRRRGAITDIIHFEPRGDRSGQG